MNTTNILNLSMLTSLTIVSVSGSISSSANLASPILKLAENSKRKPCLSSTRFNNSQRFSLEQLKQNKKKLNSFKQLPAHWNGYNSIHIDASVIDTVQDIISSLEYQPQIFPTGRGSIQLEKYLDDDNLIEIEISTSEITAYQIKNGIESESVIEKEAIVDLINNLYV